MIDGSVCTQRPYLERERQRVSAAKQVISLPDTLDGVVFNAKATRIHLYWTESTNNGDTFDTPTLASKPTTSNKKNLNDSPAPMYYDSDTRLILYNGWMSTYTNYRLYLARGNG